MHSLSRSGNVVATEPVLNLSFLIDFALFAIVALAILVPAVILVGR